MTDSMAKTMTEVPCRPCEVSYTRPHECDDPYWCPCNNGHLHTNSED